MPPVSTHFRRLIKERHLKGQSLFVIAAALKIPREHVREVLGRMGEGKRCRDFTCEQLPGTDQLTERQAYLAAHPDKMTPEEEADLAASVLQIAEQIKRRACGQPEPCDA